MNLGLPFLRRRLPLVGLLRPCLCYPGSTSAATTAAAAAVADAVDDALAVAPLAHVLALALGLVVALALAVAAAVAVIAVCAAAVAEDGVAVGWLHPPPAPHPSDRATIAFSDRDHDFDLILLSLPRARNPLQQPRAQSIPTRFPHLEPGRPLEVHHRYARQTLLQHLDHWKYWYRPAELRLPIHVLLARWLHTT